MKGIFSRLELDTLLFFAALFVMMEVRVFELVVHVASSPGSVYMYIVNYVGVGNRTWRPAITKKHNTFVIEGGGNGNLRMTYITMYMQRP